MEFDVVIVGAGPAGLSAACRIMQLAQEKEQEITVCVVEKGSEVGAHTLSGAVLEPRALNELFPDWKEMGAPVNTEVKEDKFFFYLSKTSAIKLPNFFIPKPTHNHGNYIVSMGNVCRWMAEQAEGLGVEVYPGFAAAEVLYHEDGRIKGIATGDMGISASGEQKDSYMPGMELHAKYTMFAEGCRGHLGKQLISKFSLDAGKDPQHYGIGIKEVWEIPAEKHDEGLVIHGLGWPLSESGSGGGAFMYHAENNQVYIGLIADLNYSNPHMSPFEEFQRWKHHSETEKYLEGGERLVYGARRRGYPQQREDQGQPHCHEERYAGGRGRGRGPGPGGRGPCRPAVLRGKGGILVDIPLVISPASCTSSASCWALPWCGSTRTFSVASCLSPLTTTSRTTRQ
jgi:electron-transferring-flavoprotein dehydrogenase